MRKAVEHLRAMDRPPHGVTLMSDGTGVYEAHSPEAVVDLLRNGQGVFAISLDAVYTDLEDSVAADREAAGPTGRGRRVVSAQPASLDVPPLKSDTIRFAHASERQFAKLLDFYGIDWEYEPTSFDIDFDKEGRVLQRFTPDFYLPEFDLYIEITTLNQKLVTKKNRKVRRLRERYPEISCKIFYQRDYLSLVTKYGLEDVERPPPAGLQPGHRAVDGRSVH